MILPKKNIRKLERVENPSISRRGFLRLDKNENIIGFEDSFLKKVRSKIDSDFLTSYPEVHLLYEKISKWLGIEKNRIYISSGSDGCIKSVFEVFVGEGDEVIIPHPTYAMYYVYSQMFGAKLKKIRYDRNLDLNYRSIIDAMSKRTKLICIANPNSPTGTVIPKRDLLDIVRTAQKKDILVLVDEAYYPYYPESFLSYVSSFSNLVVTRSFTKGLGLGSARLGFAVSNKYIIDCLKKVRPIYEVNSFSVLLGSLVLDNLSIMKKNMKLFKEGKSYLIQSLKSIGLEFFDTHTNFILIDVGTPKLVSKISKELLKRKILVRSGYTEPPLDRCIRVTIGSKKQMKKFIKNLRAVLELEGIYP